MRTVCIGPARRRYGATVNSGCQDTDLPVPAPLCMSGDGYPFRGRRAYISPQEARKLAAALVELADYADNPVQA